MFCRLNLERAAVGHSESRTAKHILTPSGHLLVRKSSFASNIGTTPISIGYLVRYSLQEL